MKPPIQTGEVVSFRNLAAYPSLHGCPAVVVSLKDGSCQYYGVRFLSGPMAGKRMACRESELFRA